MFGCFDWLAYCQRTGLSNHTDLWLRGRKYWENSRSKSYKAFWERGYLWTHAVALERGVAVVGGRLNPPFFAVFCLYLYLCRGYFIKRPTSCMCCDGLTPKLSCVLRGLFVRAAVSFGSTLTATHADFMCPVCTVHVYFGYHTAVALKNCANKFHTLPHLHNSPCFSERRSGDLRPACPCGIASLLVRRVICTRRVWCHSSRP